MKFSDLTHLTFNVLEWHENDEIIKNNNIEDENIENENNEEKKEDNEDKNRKKYVIKAFGKMKNGESVYLRILDYTPYFYISYDQTWSNRVITYFIDHLKTIRKSLQHHLVLYDIVEKKNFYGFTNKKSKFIRLIFNNMYEMKECAKLFDKKMIINKISSRSYEFKVFESNINPYIRFIHIRKITSVGWLSINKKKLINNEEYTTTRYNYDVEWLNVYANDDINLGIAPFKVCSFDLECLSMDSGFPQANRVEDTICQIGATFNNYGETKINKRYLFNLGSCDKIPDCTIIECKTEKELLLSFKEMIKREDPDILTGYNIFGFDEKYIYDRLKLDKNKCLDQFSELSKILDQKSRFIEKSLSSAALGDNLMKYFDILGRLQIDLLKVVQRDYKLNSYKLDKVAEHFYQDDIIKINILDELEIFNDYNIYKEYLDDLYNIDDNKINSDRDSEDEKNKDNINKIDEYKFYKIDTKNLSILEEGNYIKIIKNEESIDKKYKIIYIDRENKNFIIIEKLLKKNIDLSLIDLSKNKLKWGLVKDDVKPLQIMELFRSNSKGRKKVGLYCLQDCALVNHLINKLEIITNNISMANVCHVPLNYIFFRGQGIKSLSLVSKKCRENDYIIPLLKVSKDNNTDDDTGFEGAVVFEPEIKFHTDPIPVMDYNSLYPSSIISKNVSHETIIIDTNYDNLPNYDYYEVKYINNNGNEVICRYAKDKNNYGIIPQILIELLAERKATKKLMDKETDKFKKTILDGKQLALKVTANSIYGQLGASTSPIYLKHLAACTTAIGREMLGIARDFVEQKFTNILVSLHKEIIEKNEEEYEKLLNIYLSERNKEFENFLKIFLVELFDRYSMKPYVIYGDTDSIFINMGLKLLNNNNINIDINIDKFNNNNSHLTNEQINHIDNQLKNNIDIKYIENNNYFLILDETHKNIKFKLEKHKFKSLNSTKDLKLLNYCIELGKCASRFLKTILPTPHNMEYEKTFYPFAIMAKKKYIGNKYENDPNKFKQTSMGVVLKRRDNANIVKKVVGGLVDIMMNEINIINSIIFLTESIEKLLKGKYPITDFITSKTLKAKYAKRETQAHVVLADRIALRDPGNAPEVNDRIPFVTIVIPKTTEKKKLLQGDYIEHPDYILEHKLKIDYLFYLTNQIMNPSIQFLELVHDDPSIFFDHYIINENNKRSGRVDLKQIGFTKKNINIDEINDDCDFGNDIIKPNIDFDSKKVLKKKTNK